MLPTDINRQPLERFNDLLEDDFKENLIVIEPTKIRIRRRCDDV